MEVLAREQNFLIITKYMRDKLISYGSCVSIFQPNSKRSFGTNSPINVISGFNVPLLYSWAGSVSYTSLPSIAFGTIDRWRNDPNDHLPLNRDQWILWSTGTADLVRVQDTEKSKIPDHWSITLPTNISGESPQWVGEFIEQILKKKI